MLEPVLVRMPASTGLRVFAFVMAVALTCGVVVVVVAVRSNPGLMICSLVPLAVGFAVAWVLWRSAIVAQVDEDGVLLAFEPIWRRHLPPGEIASVELLADVSPLRFGGVGYRRMPGPTTALLWGGGLGVEIQTLDDECFVVVTPEATRLHAAVRELRGE